MASSLIDIEVPQHNTNYLEGPFRKKFDKSWKFLILFIEKCFRKYSPEKKDLLFVSVGSGNGYLEGLLTQKFGPQKFEIVGIDPNPNSFNPVPSKLYDLFCLKPMYESLDDFMKESNYKSKTLILLLFWPLYEKEGKYAYDALMNLQPSAFFVSYGPCGASGCKKLIKLLDNDDPDDKKVVLTNEISFDLFEKYTIVVGTGGGFRGKTLQILSYFQQNEKENSIIHRDLDHIELNEDECSIC